MKLLLLIMAFSFSSFAQEVDKSVRMNELLKESGVEGWGKRDLREATLICKVPRKTNELECNLRSGDVEWSRDVDRKFKGEEAVIVSNLLKEFKQFPSGNRQRQEAVMECETKKGTTIKICEVQESFDIMIMGI